MAVLSLPYSVEHYNGLPDLEEAKTRFDNSNALDAITGEIASVFLKHRAEKKFGAILLHNHFFLGAHEKLVNIGSVAVPWDMESGSAEICEVGPSAWRFTNEGLVPYEFTHGGKPAALDQAFLDDLRDVLVKCKLENTLGISKLDEGYWSKPSFMEITSGRANITLPFDLAPNAGGAIDAMWHFEAGEGQTRGL